MFDLFLSLTALRGWWGRTKCAAEVHTWQKRGRYQRCCVRCSRQQVLTFDDGWTDC